MPSHRLWPSLALQIYLSFADAVFVHHRLVEHLKRLPEKQQIEFQSQNFSSRLPCCLSHHSGPAQLGVGQIELRGSSGCLE